MQHILQNVFFRTAILVLAVFCVVMIVTLQLEFNRLEARRDALAAQITAAEERIDALEDVLAAPFDDEYVIKIAREKLNLRLPEEIVFFTDMNQ